MQDTICVAAQADGIASVWGYFWFVKNKVKHKKTYIK